MQNVNLTLNQLNRLCPCSILVLHMIREGQEPQTIELTDCGHFPTQLRDCVVDHFEPIIKPFQNDWEKRRMGLRAFLEVWVIGD